MHVGVIIFVPACAFAAWWQITRAQDGNGLSYLYSVEWPIFAILAVYFWWMLIHTDFDTVGLKGMRNHHDGDPAEPIPPVARPVEPAPSTDRTTNREDRELAEYNARLAELAKQGPGTWRNPEAPVARRSVSS